MKMSEAKLEDVWVDGGEIRLDFTNDFHCAIQTTEIDSPEVVANKLINMGKEILAKIQG